MLSESNLRIKTCVMAKQNKVKRINVGGGLITVPAKKLIRALQSYRVRTTYFGPGPDDKRPVFIKLTSKQLSHSK